MKAEMTAEETASLQAAVEKVIEFLYDDPKNLEEIKAMQKVIIEYLLWILPAIWTLFWNFSITGTGNRQ